MLLYPMGAVPVGGCTLWGAVPCGGGTLCVWGGEGAVVSSLDVRLWLLF